MNTETKHTPGLLKTTGSLLFMQQNPGGRKWYVADCSLDLGADKTVANAARLVACWNACLAMADPEKEIATLYAAAAPELLTRLTELADTADYLVRNDDYTDTPLDAAVAKARAAIAKATT